MFLSSSSRSSKTFKPKKNIPEGSHQYELLKHAEATLGSGNLRQAVMLPEGEDLNEWIAVNSEYNKHDKYITDITHFTNDCFTILSIQSAHTHTTWYTMDVHK